MTFTDDALTLKMRFYIIDTKQNIRVYYFFELS